MSVVDVPWCVFTFAFVFVLPACAALWAVEAAFDALGIDPCPRRQRCRPGEDPWALEAQGILLALTFVVLFFVSAVLAWLLRDLVMRDSRGRLRRRT